MLRGRAASAPRVKPPSSYRSLWQRRFAARMLPLAELDAAILQATITLLVLALCGGLWARTRRAYFGWWGVAP